MPGTRRAPGRWKFAAGVLSPRDGQRLVAPHMSVLSEENAKQSTKIAELEFENAFLRQALREKEAAENALSVHQEMNVAQGNVQAPAIPPHLPDTDPAVSIPEPTLAGNK